MNKNMRNFPGYNRRNIVGICLITILIVSFMLTGCGSGTVEKIKLDLYVMSQCPYGIQEEAQVMPLLEKFGSSLELNINYIATDNPDGTFTSLHGQPEVDGDIIQLCAKKYNPDKYLKLIACMNQNPGAIPSNWEECAAGLGIDPDPINRCFWEEEGKTLLKASIAKSAAARANECPTTYINDQLYEGVPSTDEIQKGICYSLKSDWPAACASVPKPQPVKATLLNDKRCTEGCDLYDVIAKVKVDFPGMQLTELDYGTEAGKKLYNEAGIVNLPALIFDEGIKQAEAYKRMEHFMEPAGKYIALRLTVPFNPTKEICDNGIDDNGDGKVDCADEECIRSLKCNELIPNSIQLFIMGDCPFGRRAVYVLADILSSTGKALTWDVRYFAEAKPDGTFKSTYGPKEVDEDMIRMLIRKYSPDKYLEFLVCRSKAGVVTEEWEKCAKGLGIDVAKISQAFKAGEGAELLRADILSQSYEMKHYPSPTWLINNRYVVFGRNKDAVLAGLCKYNKELGICKK